MEPEETLLQARSDVQMDYRIFRFSCSFSFVKFAILTGEHFGVADKILAILLLIFFDISGLLKALLLLCDSAVLLFRYICYFCEIYSC